MDKKQQTIDTYNRTAVQMADKFNASGARASDIDETFSYYHQADPFVLEIGCGNGRDAALIVPRSGHYLGIDIAENFVTLARAAVPQGTFAVADVESYEFPLGIDVVFAFASLIHVPKESLRQIMKRLHGALNVGGVVRLSLKHSDIYREVVKEDEFGTRTYFHYSLDDMAEVCSDFTIIRNDKNHTRGQDWIETVLIKE